MKRILAVIFIAIIVIAPFSLRAETITVAADEWCPYNCAPDAEKPGYIVEIAKEIFEKNGHSLSYKIMPWEKAIDFANKGYVYAIIGATRREAPGLIFPSIPQGISISHFYVKNENNWHYDGVESLSGKKIGYIEGYSYGSDVDKFISKNANSGKLRAESGDGAINKLVNMLVERKLDIVMEDRYVMAYELKEDGKVGQIKMAGAVNNRPDPLEDYLYLAFSPKRTKSEEFAKMFAEGLKEMRKSGRLKEILEKYGLEDWEKS